MFQIRIHGRGGQGVVTAAEILSVAAFDEGRHAQAFPSFGSERTGAPVVSFCRFDDREIRTHEPVMEPDAVIIQDVTLIHQVDLFSGLSSDGYVLINTSNGFSDLGFGDFFDHYRPERLMTCPATDHHTRRAQELFTIGSHISGILDIHSARGNMLCITDHKHDSELKNSPIRAVLLGLADAISANASATVTVQTLKTILHPLPNIKSQVGIEAGRHEDPNAPFNAATFTLSLLNTLGITQVAPLFTQENGIFNAYNVRPRITYADLDHADTLLPEDQIYMVKSSTTPGDTPCPGAPEFALHQYDEMEPIGAGQIVAVAIPSRTVFRTKSAFSGIFVSNSGALYDKDPSVGPWPVAGANIGNVKFCYPCDVSEITIEFP